MKIAVSSTLSRKLLARKKALEDHIEQLEIDLADAKRELSSVLANIGSGSRLAMSAPDANSELSDYKNFDPMLMSGKAWFDFINKKSKAENYEEGYWRQEFNTQENGLPFPVVYKIPGYSKTAFLKQLAEIEKGSGFHTGSAETHRWNKRNLGSKVYTLLGWSWPAGYRKYLESGVPPSRDFYRFITGGDDLPTLPSYGRAR